MAQTRVDLNSVADALRTGSLAWMDAKYESDQIEEIKYTSLKRNVRDPKSLRQVIEETYLYLEERVGGGLDSLTKNSFIVDYDLRCNLDRPARFGPDCLSMSFRVDWKKKKVEVELYNADLRRVILPAELQSMLKDGTVKSLSKLAEVTGLSTNDVKHAQTDKIETLMAVIGKNSAGQNKLTRLVKGCLMFLDHLEKGSQKYEMKSMSTLKYEVADIVTTVADGELAYVYCDQDGNNVVNWVLYSMCEEYPHPIIGGCDHIKIPADGKQVVMVGRAPRTIGATVYISAPLIWGTLMQYCEHFNLGRDLESALAIACCLRENKYLSVVSLPRVVSGVDLIYPALAKMPHGVNDKTFIDIDSAYVLGRVQQMLMLTLVKDIGTSARCSSIIQQNVKRNIQSLFSRDSSVFLEYMEEKTVTDLMKITRPMNWLRHLTDRDLDSLMLTSVFESFWLVSQPKQVIESGIISALKKGTKHPIGLTKVGVNVDHFSVLLNEVELGGEVPAWVVPDGRFHVSFSCLRSGSLAKWEPIFEYSGLREKVEYSFEGMSLEGAGPGSVSCLGAKPNVRTHGGSGWELESEEEDEYDEEEEGYEEEVYPEKKTEVEKEPLVGSEKAAQEEARLTAALEDMRKKSEEESARLRAEIEKVRKEKEKILEEARKKEEGEKKKAEALVAGQAKARREKEDERIRSEKAEEMRKIEYEEKRRREEEETKRQEEARHKMEEEEGKRSRDEETESQAQPETDEVLVETEDEEEVADEEDALAEAKRIGEAKRMKEQSEAEAQAAAAKTALKKPKASMILSEDIPQTEENIRLFTPKYVEDGVIFCNKKYDREKFKKMRDHCVDTYHKGIEVVGMPDWCLKAMAAEVKREAAMARSVKRVREEGTPETGAGSSEKTSPSVKATVRAMEKLSFGHTPPGGAKKTKKPSPAESAPGPKKDVIEEDERGTVQGLKVDMKMSDLLAFDFNTVEEVLDPRNVYCAHVNNFCGYLSTLPFGMYKKATLAMLRTNPEWVDDFEGRVEYFVGHDSVPVKEYPELWQPTIERIREWVNRNEKERMEETYALFEGVEFEDDIRKGVVKEKRRWRPRKEDGVVTVQMLNKVNRLLVDNEWWVKEIAMPYFATKNDKRVVTRRELDWFAKYADHGGNLEGWNTIWKIANHEPTLAELDWHLIGGQHEAIRKNINKKKEAMRVKYKPGADAKQFLNKTNSLTFSTEMGITREKYDDMAHAVAHMPQGKWKILLGTYIITGVRIAHPLMYALCFKLIEFQSEGDVTFLAEELREYLDYLS